MKIFHFNPEEEGPIDVANRQIRDAIDRALEKENESQEKRDYLGGSRMGVSCLRALGFEYHHIPVDCAPQFAGKIIRRFRLGHIHEDETARWFKLAGFGLETLKDGKQFAFEDSAVGWKISGHLDGIIYSLPPEMEDFGFKLPWLWEHKIMKRSKWNEFKKHGLRKANLVYWYQCHTYMAYEALGACLFVALNTDTSELWAELFSLDVAEAQFATDRGFQVVRSKSPLELPRHTDKEDHYLCKMCAWKQRCWEE
jgi:hypothetical protein